MKRKQRQLTFFMAQPTFQAITKQGYWLEANYVDEEKDYQSKPCILLIPKPIWNKVFKDFAKIGEEYFEKQGFFDLSGHLGIEALEDGRINFGDKGKYIEVYKALPEWTWMWGFGQNEEWTF